MAVALTAILLFWARSSTAPGSSAAQNVTVSGTVSRSGGDIIYMGVSFKSSKSNSTYVADVVHNMYTISLPNNDTYEVELLIRFVGYSTPRAYSQGTMILSTNQTSYQFDMEY
jgi:hypothetical protein